MTAAPDTGDAEPVVVGVDPPVASAGGVRFSPGCNTLVVAADCDAAGKGEAPANAPGGDGIGEFATGGADGRCVTGLAVTAAGEAVIVAADGCGNCADAGVAAVWAAA